MACSLLALLIEIDGFDQTPADFCSVYQQILPPPPPSLSVHRVHWVCFEYTSFSPHILLFYVRAQFHHDLFVHNNLLVRFHKRLALCICSKRARRGTFRDCSRSGPSCVLLKGVPQAKRRVGVSCSPPYAGPRGGVTRKRRCNCRPSVIY